MRDKETGEDLPFLLLDQNFFDTKLMVHLIDAQTGNEINSDIIVYLTGDDSQKVVDFNGKRNESYQVNNGYFEVAINPSVVPSVDAPVNLVVYANSENYSWYSLPTEVSIVQSGLTDVVVTMYSQDSENLEEIEEDVFMNSFSSQTSILKSANIVIPFAYSVNTNKKGAYINKYDQVKYMLGYYVYFHVQPKFFNTNYERVKLTAKNYTGNDLNNYGFFGSYFDNNNIKTINQLQTNLDNSNIKNFMFYGATKENI
ncbi:MAG TPA: hypothetical protein PLS94_01055 [Prolixibacteraceae bacterium]|nr:hypothetical protein [Prolixibacteraceae bacterium]